LKILERCVKKSYSVMAGAANPADGQKIFKHTTLRRAVNSAAM